MTTQTLEMIPEETVTPATPERVTSVFQKRSQQQQKTLVVLLLIKD